MTLFDGYPHYSHSIGQHKVDKFCKQYNLTKEEFNHLIELIRNSNNPKETVKEFLKINYELRKD